MQSCLKEGVASESRRRLVGTGMWISVGLRKNFHWSCLRAYTPPFSEVTFILGCAWAEGPWQQALEEPLILLVGTTGGSNSQVLINKGTRYKINMQKSTVCLRASNKEAERETKQIPVTATSKE